MLGFINIYKPSGLTSSNVVVKLRKKFHLDKIGHMGTLDPMACGILPIAIGKATRMFDYFLDKYKTYIATFEFGYETNTLDLDGEVVNTTRLVPSQSEVMRKLGEFLGKSNQIPPNFSAKLVNGVRSYKLAREGINIELKPKEIEITKFKFVCREDNKYTFEITCSSGTYIRAIGRDLAKSLNSLCTMTKLERVESGVFNLNNSYTLEEILESDTLENFLIDVETVFPKILKIDINEFLYNRIRNGLSIHNTYNIKNIAFVKYNNQLIGVAENIDNELKLKTYLME